VTSDPQADPRTLVLRREYPDAIDEVWAALTESDRLARWIGTYTGRGGAGTTVAFTLTGEADAGGEVAPPVTVPIVECSPPRRLVVDIPDADGGAWRIAVTLSDESGPTVLRFEQLLVEGFDAADVEAGWRWYLDRLGASLQGEAMPEWADYQPTGS
jgi:uncharacterized protein YndB with AHSA1/START domain